MALEALIQSFRLWFNVLSYGKSYSQFDGYSRFEVLVLLNYRYLYL